jgi:hypothetical protein
MKTLFLGIALIILIGFGGFFYRNALEYSNRQIKCPVDTFVCPDGTKLEHTGLACDFPACPPPNVSIAELGLAFALPEGFEVTANTEPGSVATYKTPSVTSFEDGSVIIRRYPITASTTALAIIEESSSNNTAGLPVSPTRYTSATINGRNFTVVPVDRFEGVIVTAYYLVRGQDVLRFDAIDRGADWTNPELDIFTLPTHRSLVELLGTLQGQ